MKNGPGSLNRIYRLVWNEACGAFVAVAENASGRGKRSSRTAGALLSSVLLAGMAGTAMAAGPQPPPVNALPAGGQVVAGQARIDQSGARMDVTQGSAQAILNWNTFNIGANAHVNFQQPGAASIALNRVTSADPSAIFGRLSANGQVMLINPNGIAFGASARVDVGGIAASTLQLSDADFLARRFKFSRDGSTAGVLNQGEIRAVDGGYVALLAPEVRNEGVLQARLGTVAMAAGDAVTFDLSDNRLLSVKVDPASIATLVENRQLIQAEGGQVLLSAGAAQRLAEQAIAGSGGATALVNDNGVMRLVAVGGQVDAGQVKVEGRLVDVSGEVSTSAAAGGRIEVSADTLLQSGGLRADGASGQGGQIALDATQVMQTASAVVSADGATGGGSIDVQGGHTGALGDDAGRIYSSGTFSARGTGAGAVGGHIDLSADSVQLRAATLDADGRAGGGRLRVGGGFQGRDADLANALDVGINANTVLRADAVDSGTGGEVIVWSDQTTAFAGQIAARGGAAGGDGGQAEVSGKLGLAFAGNVDLSAARGAKGALLLDPRDIVIDDADATIASLALDSPDADVLARFGANTAVLANGNVVVTAPDASTAGLANTGAVYLFDTRTGALLGQLRGSHEGDRVGEWGITVLDNQNYLVKTPNWNPVLRTANTVDGVTTYSGGATHYSGSYGGYRLNSNVDGAAGAITWQSGTGSNGGASAIVGASNSLIGDNATNDRVASANQTKLSNGNLVFSNTGWNNGRGAVTWMDAGTGKLADGSSGGLVSAANSLVGSTAIRATALQEGGIWITGINQTTPTTHTYSGGARNGTSDVPNVMGPGDEVGSAGIVVLANGAYAVASPLWTSSTDAYVGAVTYGAAGGTVGAVSTTNSLHGVNAYDFAGSLGVTPVGAADADGRRADYVVVSPYWGSGDQFLQTTAMGAVTWVDGATGLAKGETSTGAAIDSGNSLVGNTGDHLGSSAAGSSPFYTALTETWYTYGTGYYSVSNYHSLSAARGTASQSGIKVLANGNYLVASTTTGSQKGSVTFGDGGSGIAGTLSSGNSLLGATSGDTLGSGGIFELSGGRYAVNSPAWDGPGAVDAGAVSWGSATGATGVVSVTNSLVGSGAYDRVGSGGLRGVGAVDNGGLYANAIVLSPYWGSGAAVSTSGKGAVSWIEGSTGHLADGQAGGQVSAGNSLVGANSADYVGSFHHSDSRSGFGTNTGVSTNAGAWSANLTSTVDVLENGNYLVRSPSWDAGKGAATWGSGTSGATGAVGAGNSLVGTTADVYAPQSGTAQPAGDQTGRTFDTVTRTMTQTGDHVGLQARTLPNGNVAVASPFWSDGRGAVTLVDGSNGKPAGSATQGAAVSAANSLVGSTPDTYTIDANGGRTAVANLGDHVGAVPNDKNYVVPVVSNLQGVPTTVVTTQMLLAPYQLGYSGGVGYSWYDPTYQPDQTYHYRPVTTGSNSSYSGMLQTGIDVLPSGDLLVRSASWNNGSAAEAGAVTWMNGSTGRLSDGNVGGAVSSANSLVGSHAGDRLGADGFSIVGENNLLLRDSTWHSSRGAVTWMNGRTGLLANGSSGGEIGEANSLLGSTGASIVTLNGWHYDAATGSYVNGEYQGSDNLGDRVGSEIQTLTDGNLVVRSYEWGKTDNAYTYKGAVTWMDSQTGKLTDGSTGGAVSATNSLVGTQGGDRIGSYGVMALADGAYVVNSPSWKSGELANAGAVTWSGAGGTVGEVSAENSLIGQQANDQIGSGGVTDLGDGRYVVSSPYWANGDKAYAGAATWGGATGITGVVSVENSLVGTHAYDFLGSYGVEVLRDADNTYTNYIIKSGQWNQSAGAVTWVDGNTGHAHGDSSSGAVVSAANSLVGTTQNGGYTGMYATALRLNNVGTGDVVISSDYWQDCGLVGAVTFMPGATGLAGQISWRNSLLNLQGTASSNIGWGYAQYTVLPGAASSEEKVNNRVVVWTPGGNSKAVVMTVVDETAAQPHGVIGHSTLSVAAGDGPNWRTPSGFAGDATGFATLGGADGKIDFSTLSGSNLVITPGVITGMLDAGTDVTLQASNNITVAKAVVTNNPQGNGGDLSLQAGRAIHINADVVTDNGNFSALANASEADGVVATDCGTCTPGIFMKDGVSIDAGTGNVDLTVQAGGEIQGNVVLGSVSAGNVVVSNAIGSIRSNTAATVAVQADTANDGQLTLRAARQVVLGNDTAGQSLTLDGAGITIEASGFDSAGAGSVQLTSGVALSGHTLAVQAGNTAARSQIGGSNADGSLADANADFWLDEVHLGRVISQSTGFDAVQIGRIDQSGVTDFRGADLSSAASSAITVQGGSGGLLLSGVTTLAAGKTLTLSDTSGSMATNGSFSAINPTSGDATLALRSDGAITLDNASIDLPGATLSIETSGTTPVASSATTSITAGSLRLKGANAAFDFTAGNGVQVGTLAADVQSLALVNSGALGIGNVGDTRGVSSQHGVLLEARGSQADLTLDATVHSTDGDLLLAAGRHFVNNTAFDTGLGVDSGRFLVYSANPADTIEGMTVTAKHYNQGYVTGTTPSYAGSGNWFLYSVAPTLSVGAGNVSVVYGSSDSDSASNSFSGFIDGDSFATAGITGTLPTLTISSGATSSAGHRVAGTYATSFSGSLATLASNLGYGFVAGESTGTYTVTQRDLTFNGTQVYDGSTVVAASQLTGSDKFANDAVVLGGAGSRDRNVGTGKSVDLGTLSISGADAANYHLSAATLDVTARGVTVAADNARKVYGDTDPTLGFQVGGLGLASGDTLGTVFTGGLATTTGAAATAGSHAILQGNLQVSSNYLISSYQAGTLTVAKAALTVKADDQSKVYGDATPTLGYTVNAAQLKYTDAADVVSGVTLATAQGAAATAGTHAITASGGMADNYTLSRADGTLTVAKAALTVTADDQSKVFGTPTPALTYTVNADQLKYGDASSVVSGIALATVEGVDATAGTHPITLSGGTAANYSLVMHEGTFTISPESLKSESLMTQVPTTPAIAPPVPATPPEAEVTPAQTGVPSLRPGQVTIVGGGMQVQSGAALTAMPLSSIVATSGQRLNYTLPATTFQQAGSTPAVSMAARMSDGRPLPAWLSFDATTGQLSGTPPEGMNGKLSVQIQATGADGAQVTTSVEIHIAS